MSTAAAGRPPATPGDTPQDLFRLAVRVYWEDTDAGGVVFYANYLKFFERARTEWLRALGHSQEALRRAADPADRAMFVVTDTQVRYLRPARLDDWLDITVQAPCLGPASLVVRQQALRGTELLAEGEIRIACVHPDTLRPRRLPAALLSDLDFDLTAS